MSNVIQFLESLGGRSAPSAAEYAAIVAGLDVNEAQQQALLARDHNALNDLLNGRSKMLFYVNTPSPDDHEAIPDADNDGDGLPDDVELPHKK